MQQHEGTILFRNTMRITDGHLEGFARAIRDAVEFVEAKGPQLLVEVFLDEQRMLAYSYQLYRDSDAIRAHWEMSDPYIQEVMKHCTVQHFAVYGEPDERVMNTMLSAGFEVEVLPRLAGFTR